MEVRVWISTLLRQEDAEQEAKRRRSETGCLEKKGEEAT
jgi:hypothetical protein